MVAPAPCAPGRSPAGRSERLGFSIALAAYKPFEAVELDGVTRRRRDDGEAAIRKPHLGDTTRRGEATGHARQWGHEVVRCTRHAVDRSSALELADEGLERGRPLCYLGDMRRSAAVVAPKCRAAWPDAAAVLSP
jgi:hypothetical protein